MKVLVVVDVQNDFMPGGALAVPYGNEVIDPINRVIDSFHEQDHMVVATQDLHPKNHESFAVNSNTEPFTVGTLHGLTQVWWPVHCVENTFGSYLHEDLRHIKYVYCKGWNPHVDSYSGFFDNGKRHSTKLTKDLQEAKSDIDEVVIVGLALDYCVAFTAQDSRDLDFPTTVLMDCCRGVDFPKGSVDDALKNMKNKGINLTTSYKFLREFNM